MQQPKIQSAIASRAVKAGDKLKLLKNGHVARCDYSERGVGFAAADTKAGCEVTILPLPKIPPAGEMPLNLLNILAANSVGRTNIIAENTDLEFPPVLLWDRHEDGFLYYAVKVKVEVCTSCHSPMIDTDDAWALYHELKLVGVKRFWGMLRGGRVCMECKGRDNRENFECDLCEKTYPKADVQWSYDGNGIGYLCKHCYATASAAVWEKAQQDIKDSHQYYD